MCKSIYYLQQYSDPLKRVHPSQQIGNIDDSTLSYLLSCFPKAKIDQVMCLSYLHDQSNRLRNIYKRVSSAEQHLENS